ncbi:MAG TPA: TonB-dependent receptor [bacterium]|mgnify:CR=1 FL=1|nr:TonB-dependent receptor [bacterium]
MNRWKSSPFEWLGRLGIAALLAFPSRAPGGDFVWKIDMAEADGWNYRSFADILELLPGIWVRDLGLTGQFAPFRFAGAPAEQSVLCVDGVPLAEPWTEAVDLNRIPPEMVERIEIYPETNPFGLSQIGAAVNLVTRRPEPKRPETTFLYRTGGNGYSDLDIAFAQTFFSRLSLSSAVTLRKFAEDVPGIAYREQGVRARIAYRILERLRFRYDIMDGRHEGDMPHALTLPDHSARLSRPARKITHRDQRLALESSVLDLKSILLVQMARSEYLFRPETAEGPPPSRTPVGRTALDWSQDARQAGLPLGWGLRLSENRLTGRDGKKFTAREQTAHVRIDPEYGTVSPRADLVLVRFMEDAPRLSPALSADWRPSASASAGFSVSRRFRHPSLGETSGYALPAGPPETPDEYRRRYLGTAPFGNQSLKPERSDQAGIHIRLTPLPPLDATVRFFMRDTRDRIRFNPDTLSPGFVNSGKARFGGIETMFRAGPFHRIELSGVVNYLRAVDGGGNFLQERPAVWGRGAVSWSQVFFRGDLKVRLQAAAGFRSEFWALVQDQSVLAGDPGVIFDLKAVLTVMKHADVFLELDNLLNAGQFRVYGFPQTGRAFRYGLRWTVFD